ncbi:MAG: rRNA pseudouridine synthase [Acidobacteria bacterium]|nr:rRNA pseudouridine synthase [Acidobacteriota bacterium]MBI3423548.1 rRNA pseudouridine synthase [Acidobacteriota bacterium]
MTEELLRLSKLMAQRGLCSRREADSYIEQGLVKVNGVVVNQLGTKVAPDVRIELAARAVQQQRQLVTILLNKPIGVVSAQPEPGYTPAITLLTAVNQFINQSGAGGPKLKPEHLRGLAVAGRLDIDSQGLLLFTQDGRIAKLVIGAEGKLEKEYIVRVGGGYLDEARLKLLRHGLSLDDKPLKPAKVDLLNNEQLRIVLTEGRKRQIRRMCELVGLRVLGLKRVRIGNLRLGNLPEGQWRFLADWERLD